MAENPSTHSSDQTQPAVGFGPNAGGADYSAQSDQPLMKHVLVEITPSKGAAPSRDANAIR
jgi:hypothetical protein